jgi:uncharacterized protein YecE (DUF72 family)
MSKRRDKPGIYVGCAGWNLPSADKPEFPAQGTHLARYAARFPAVEINSSFYRPHRTSTYAKWAASVPAGFRFSVKVPKAITHTHRLAGSSQLLKTFLGEAGELGDKLGYLLVQLPPRLDFQPEIAKRFFSTLRNLYQGSVVLEARHATWFTEVAGQLLRENRIGGVAADPAPAAAAAEPSGWSSAVYYRLHGSPHVYYSAYGDDYLSALAARLAGHAKTGAEVWCIFDNTAAGAAIPNAFALMRELDMGGADKRPGTTLTGLQAGTNFPDPK